MRTNLYQQQLIKRGANGLSNLYETKPGANMTRDYTWILQNITVSWPRILTYGSALGIIYILLDSFEILIKLIIGC